jgi:hypothetical protein
MNKRGMEMTISMVIMLVLGLILLSIGIYLIYAKILKPSEGTTSFIACDGPGKVPDTVPGCINTQPCGVCARLPSSTGKELTYCCIKETS